MVGRPDLDETIRRLQAYAEAGADCLYAPRIGTVEQVAAIVAAVAPKPVNLLINAPFITVAEAAALGVRRISVGGTLARTAWGGFLQAAHEIADARHVHARSRTCPTSTDSSGPDRRPCCAPDPRHRVTRIRGTTLPADGHRRLHARRVLAGGPAGAGDRRQHRAGAGVHASRSPGRAPTCSSVGLLDDGGETRRLVEDGGRTYAETRADITQPGVPGEVVAQCVDALGGLDVLVNSAGICLLADVDDFDRSQWDPMVAVNLTAAFEMAREAEPGDDRGRAAARSSTSPRCSPGWAVGSPRRTPRPRRGSPASPRPTATSSPVAASRSTPSRPATSRPPSPPPPAPTPTPTAGSSSTSRRGAGATRPT